MVVLLAGLAAVTHAACGGKVVIEEENIGAGGASSSSGSKSVSVGTSVVSTSNGPMTVTASATTGSGPCVGCGEFITYGEGELCPQSVDIYDAFLACVCVKDKGCTVQCATNACINQPATDACFQCISSACKDELNACANDI